MVAGAVADGTDRAWQLTLAVLAALVGLVAWLLQHELAQINARLDRITTYVLEHRGEQPEP